MVWYQGLEPGKLYALLIKPRWTQPSTLLIFWIPPYPHVFFAEMVEVPSGVAHMMPQMDVDRMLSLKQVRVCILVERNLTVLNISNTGLAVSTDRPLTMGQSYRLYLSSLDKDLTVDGEVSRCNLNELEPCADGTQEPHYLNGIQFKVRRSPEEIGIQDLLSSNLTGEKRRSSRIRPLCHMSVNIGNTCFTEVARFTLAGMLLQSDALIDLDRDWNLMVQADDESRELKARVLQASKKAGETTYSIQIEFIGVDEGQKSWLEHVVSHLGL